MLDEGKKSGGLPPARVAAGAQIARLIDEKFATRMEFADAIGIPDKKVSDLVNGRKKMDAKLANSLAGCFELQPSFFWDLEKNFEEEFAKDAPANGQNDRDIVDGVSQKITKQHLASQPLERFIVGDRVMELTAGTPPERVKALADIFFR
jgi:plasmid maintenance system antidote protein VapI